MTVVIISPSKFFREAIRFILQDMREISQIDAFERPEDIPHGRAYDLVLCDLSCKGVESEGIRKLKELGSKVIVFSFDPFEKMKDTVRKIGADGYVHRPLDPRSVKEAVLSLR